MPPAERCRGSISGSRQRYRGKIPTDALSCVTLSPGLAEYAINALLATVDCEMRTGGCYHVAFASIKAAFPTKWKATETKANMKMNR